MFALVSLLYLLGSWGEGQALPFRYPTAGSYYGNYYNPEGYLLNNLEQRLSGLQNLVTSDLQQIQSRLQEVEQVLTAVARQECQTNKVILELCPGFDQATVNQIISCVVAPIAGAQMVNVTRHVVFPSPFLNPPVVSMGLSGQVLVSGKNCSVQIGSVSPEGFIFTFLADDLLPVEIELVWYACPSALFTQQQSLPGDLRGLPTSGTGSGAVKHRYVGPGGKIWD